MKTLLDRIFTSRLFARQLRTLTRETHEHGRDAGLAEVEPILDGIMRADTKFLGVVCDIIASKHIPRQYVPLLEQVLMERTPYAQRYAERARAKLTLATTDRPHPLKGERILTDVVVPVNRTSP